MLSELGRREAAFQAAEEAVTVYRGLAEARPDAFLPDLARSLGTFGLCLKAAGHPRDALAAFAEGIGALRPAFLVLPTAFAGLMRALAREYITLATEHGEEPDGELLAPIIAKFEELSGEESSK